MSMITLTVLDEIPLRTPWNLFLNAEWFAFFQMFMWMCENVFTCLDGELQLQAY